MKFWVLGLCYRFCSLLFLQMRWDQGLGLKVYCMFEELYIYIYTHTQLFYPFGRCLFRFAGLLVYD